MKKYWWKVLSVLLLLYVFIAGMGTPLGPGILKVSPAEVHSGLNKEVLIKGYNTHFLEGTRSLEVWLESEGKQYCARELSVQDDDEVMATFRLPETLPDNTLHLWVQNEVDGTFNLTEAFWTKAIGEGNSKGNCDITPIGRTEAFTFPFKKILYESIRNLFFHVPMWFAMMGIMLLSVIISIRYLASGDPDHDRKAVATVHVGLLFAVLGLLTGSVWARFTWGAWWVDDTKLNGAAITTLIYLAYLILRNSVNETQKKGRIAAVYNIFAFTMLLVFLMILPRMTDSLHPGSGGNPAFSKYDLNENLRMIFYPAVAGWFLLGLWIMEVRVKIDRLKEHLAEREEIS